VHQLGLFEGGHEGFESFLVDRIVAHGGSCEFGERVESLLFRRGRVSGVVAGGGDLAIGAEHVVTGLPGPSVIELAEGRALGAAGSAWPELRPVEGRFVMSCVMATAGLPKPLAHESVVVPHPARNGAGQLSLHLQRRPIAGLPGHEQLIVEALVPLGSSRRLGELRGEMLATLKSQFPFIEAHLQLVDSPHDGLPVDVYHGGRATAVERSQLTLGCREAEPLEARWQAAERGFLGLAGEPMRGPVRGTFLVGTTVFPGLGQEGELLAAWNVARSITETDRAWQKRRRQMWSKIDTD
jgi:hypothetical protein